MDCSITCFWMSWNSMWKRVEGEGGKQKKTAYAIQFPILVRCSCLFACVKLQKVNAVLFSVLVEHLHVMLITCFPCMSFTGTTSTFSALLSVASSSKNWRKNTSNETCCLKNNNVICYIKHVLTDFFPFLSFFPFLTVFSVERKAIWNFTETQLGITDVGNSVYKARIVTAIT